MGRSDPPTWPSCIALSPATQEGVLGLTVQLVHAVCFVPLATGPGTVALCFAALESPQARCVVDRADPLLPAEPLPVVRRPQLVTVGWRNFYCGGGGLGAGAGGQGDCSQPSEILSECAHLRWRTGVRLVGGQLQLVEILIPVHPHAPWPRKWGGGWCGRDSIICVGCLF